QDQRGDPQKLGPCGGTTANPGQASKAVTTLTGGAKLHIKIQETVYHPGHYRVALAGETLEGRPAAPQTLTKGRARGPPAVSASFKDSRRPVLVDGLFLHSVRPAAGASQFWETDVRIPNIDCAACTLQVVQWMAEHGYNTDGGYTYHH